jgi:hypothetical protein
MMKTRMLALLLMVSGCAPLPEPGLQPDREVDSSAPTKPAEQEAAPATPLPGDTFFKRVVQPGDPPVIFRPQANLSVYRINAAAGASTANEALWKHIDEAAVDAATYDLLFRNGLRVGRGRMADWDLVMGMLDEGPVKREPDVYIAAGSRDIELPMRQKVVEQTIYHFNERNEFSMRSFDESDNILCVEFSTAPRKAGDVRIRLCPMVRSLRKRLVPIGDIETREIEVRSDERFYPLNLSTDVPLDGFLIVAPSPEARSAMSLGGSFLMKPGVAQRLEEVLIFVPQAIRPKTPTPAEANAAGAGRGNQR